MRRTLLLGIGATLGFVLPLGCTTTEPTVTLVASKVTAPTLVSPVSGAPVSTLRPTLVLQRISGENTSSQVSYDFQVTTPSGDIVYTRTVAGGAADGLGTVSHVVEVALPQNGSFRWRARAAIGGDRGPWSSDAPGSVMFVTTAPVSAASSNDEFRDYFFALIVQKGVGSIATQQGLATMEPDLTSVGIILAKANDGSLRGRIYLPTGNPSDLFARTVDVAPFGSPWIWSFRGRTVCEGICPS